MCVAFRAKPHCGTLSRDGSLLLRIARWQSPTQRVPNSPPRRGHERFKPERRYHPWHAASHLVFKISTVDLPDAAARGRIVCGLRWSSQ